MSGLDKSTLGRILGATGAATAMIGWYIMVFHNPFTGGRANSGNTLFTVFLPACLALLSALIKRPFLMFTAFVWSFPISLYISLANWIVFKLFGISLLLYLVSTILMRNKPSRSVE